MLAPLLLAAMLAQPAFETKPCAAELATDPSITCGYVRVLEDRGQPGGRVIDLNVVILRSTTSTPDLPPLFDIEGGPGNASTIGVAFYRKEGIAYRARRDVVLVDQRGTGGSNPLNCPRLAAGEAALGPLYPPALVAQCRDGLIARADLSKYGTAAAAADLDAVREALGHEKIDIVAISYGTTLSLRYLAAYPTRVRAAVLSGVVPAAAMPPQHHAVVADAALTRIFEDCTADSSCRAAFPHPDADLREALRRLGHGERRPSAPSGEPLSAPVFMEKLRTMLYGPRTARTVPRIVHFAAGGDFAPFLEAAGSGSPAEFSDGLYLTITCSESFGAMDFARAAAASRVTRFGDYRLRRQRDACASWPMAMVEKEFHQPVHSRAQILLISGGRDPVTPPEWAALAAQTLPNAKHVLIPWAGHIIDGLSGIDSCYDPMLLRFFDAGDVRKVDASCVSKMVPPPFAAGR